MKVYLNKINESWIIDRIRKEWYIENKQLVTKFPRFADIFWLLSPWVWKNVNKKILKEKKILCSYYHFDFSNFDKNDFYELDNYVDQYHVICEKTKKQLSKLTSKKITSIPFWLNQDIFYYISDKERLRKKLGLDNEDYLIGSFQRDTEGKDHKSPKLIKGPDIFLDIVKDMYKNNKKIKVILSGTRREYITSELNKFNIPYRYFKMASFNMLNELYNVLDLYLVTSRIEGGPQAILECAYTRTPILSTDVGVAPEILSPKSIYSTTNYQNAVPDLDHAYNKSLEFILPNGMKKFQNMFLDMYEN